MRHGLAAVVVLLAGSASLLGAAGDLTIAAAARSMQPGELVVLTVTTPVPVDAVRVHAFNREIRAFRDAPRTWRALVGIDLDVRPGPYGVSVDAQAGAGALHGSYPLRVRPKTFATRTLSVDEAFVTPPAGVQPRIDREAAELLRIWKNSAPDRLWSAPFLRPVPGDAVSRFGTRSIFNGKPRSPHGGADFLSPSGTPIHAPNAGRVVLARDLYFSGNTVVIDHGLGLFSLLAHLSAIAVHDGDAVEAGQVVGRVGATGRVTGPHLHWAVRASDARVDPLSVLALLGADVR